MPMFQVPSRFRSYDLLEELPAGLSGEVYKARYKDGTVVALKLLSRKHEKDQTVFSYFTNEIVLLRELGRHQQHPHLVKYFRDNLTEPPYYIATYFVEGSRSLLSLMGQPLPHGFVLRVVEQISSALDFLHYVHPEFSPIIHRDVKPGNILIDATDNTVLIDLSIASHPNVALAQERGLGSPNYMAPEQYEGSEVPATDQFALAAVALHMLTGRTLLPNDAKRAHRKLEQLRDSSFAEIQSLLGPQQQQIATVIKRAMSYDPLQRYQDCQEFAYALRNAFQQDGATLAVEVPRVSTLPRYLGWLAMGMVGIVALVALLLASWPATEATGGSIASVTYNEPTVSVGLRPTLLNASTVGPQPTATLAIAVQIDAATPEPGGATVIIQDQSEPLRGGRPSTQAAVLTRMPPGSTAIYLGEEQSAEGVTWYKVNYQGQVGWCRQTQCRLQ